MSISLITLVVLVCLNYFPSVSWAQSTQEPSTTPLTSTDQPQVVSPGNTPENTRYKNATVGTSSAGTLLLTKDEKPVLPAPLPEPNAILVPDTPAKAKEVTDLPVQPGPSIFANSNLILINNRNWGNWVISGETLKVGTEKKPISLPTTSPLLELTRLLTTTSRNVVAVSLRIVEWVFSFELAALLMPLVSALSHVVSQELFAGIRVLEVVTLAAVAHMLYRIMVSEHSKAMTQLLVLTAVLGTGYGVLSGVQSHACQGLTIVKAATNAVFAFTQTNSVDAPLTDGCTQDGATSPVATQLENIGDAVFTTYVQEPFLLMQWGPLTPSCRETALALVNRGTYGDSPEPRNVMKHKGCEANAAFNAGNYAERLSLAAMYSFGVLLFAGGLGAIAATVVLAQIGGALLVLLAPFLLVAAVFPTSFKPVVLKWSMALAKITGLLLASAALLSFALSMVVPLNAALNSQHAIIHLLIPSLFFAMLAAGPWWFLSRTSPMRTSET